MSNLTALIAAVLTTGLQAWHKFTATTWSGSNRLPDSSPVGTNTAALYTGRGLSFEGVNDVVTVGATGVTVKTVVFYAYPDTTTQAFMQLQSTGAVRIEISGGTLSATGFTSPTLYVNGAASSTVAATTWQQIAVTSATGVSASNVLFGQSNTTYLSGDLSNVKFFSTQLTAQQIAELYANPEQALPTGSVAAELVGWWPMMAGTNNSNSMDGTTNRKHGTISGATDMTKLPSPVPQIAITSFNKMMAFDGTDDRVTLSNSIFNPDNAHTVAMHIFLISNDFGGIFSGGSTDFGIRLSSGRLRVSKIGVSDAINGNTQLADGGLKYVTLTRTGNDWEIKINNVSDATATTALTFTATNKNIGEANTAYFKGHIKSVAVWNKKLTDAEITALYNGGDVINAATNSGDYVSAANLVGYWINTGTFNSDWIDRSTAGNNGTVAGSPGLAVIPAGLTSGKDILGNSFSFTNTGQLITNGQGYALITDAASLDITTNITLEAWVKPFTVTSAQTIIGKNTAYALGVTAAGKPVFSKWTSTTKTATATTTTTVTANVWTHLAATYDGTNVKIYINGTLNTTTAVSGAIDATATDVLLGALTSSTELFNGYIDSAKVYSAALTATQVLTNYSVESTEYA